MHYIFFDILIYIPPVKPRNIFLFTFPVPSFSKIACFETSSKLLPVVLGDFRDLVKDNKFQQAISACAELAFDKSYKFFVLGYYGICRSGPNARQQYHSKSSLSDKNCPNGIGIGKRIQVYTFGKFTLGSISTNIRNFPSAVFVAHVLVGPSKQLKQIIQTEHNIVRNPNWPEANHLAICKRGRGFELGANEKQIQVVVIAGLEPGTARLRV